jgi:hypothetical protein
MGNILEIVAGLMIIGFTFMILIFATPSLMDATDTSAGHIWENESTTTKAAQDVNHNVVSIFPFALFFIGFAVALDGMRR